MQTPVSKQVSGVWARRWGSPRGPGPAQLIATASCSRAPPGPWLCSFRFKGGKQNPLPQRPSVCKVRTAGSQRHTPFIPFIPQRRGAVGNYREKVIDGGHRWGIIRSKASLFPKHWLAVAVFCWSHLETRLGSEGPWV